MKYRESHVETSDVSGNGIQRKMDALKSEGWRDLSFRICTSDVSADTCMIEGRRPLTVKEIRDIEMSKTRDARKEISTMKRLAKKHGYGLTPPGEDGQ